MKSDKAPALIEYLGEAAHGLLISHSRGKILAVFSQAAYLLEEKGELFWIGGVRNPNKTTPAATLGGEDAAESDILSGSLHVPMHRRGLRLSSFLPKLIPGTPWFVEDCHLIFDSRTVLDYSKACIWRAPHLYPDSLLPVTAVRQRVGVIPSILGRSPAPAGFGSLIPGNLCMLEKQSAPLRLDNLPYSSESLACDQEYFQSVPGP